jgi:uncharacterized membrane protein
MLERIEEIRENIFRYLEARIELFTLEMRGRVEDGAVQVVHSLVLALLGMMTLIFLFSLLAAYLNEVTESRYMGFVIVAGFFLVLTVIWAVAKDILINRIRLIAYSIIKKSQTEKDNDKSEAVQDLMAQMKKIP